MIKTFIIAAISLDGFIAKIANLEGVELTMKKPADLLSDLETRGYKEVAICGGASIYTMFLEANLVDTLYLTIEPKLFGKGVSLLNKLTNVSLTLATTKHLSKD